MTQTTTTSPSDLDDSFYTLINKFRHQSPSSIGAGQRATAINGLALLALFTRWGTPLYPNEPISTAIAKLQREIDAIDTKVQLLETFRPAHPAVTKRVEDLYYYRAEAWHLMHSLMTQEKPTEHSQATSPAEYAFLLLPRIPTNGDKPDYHAIKEKLDIVEYISQHSSVQRVGQTWRATCPLHDDQHPSLCIYPSTRSWYCFVCQRGGDIFDYEKARSGTLPVTT